MGVGNCAILLRGSILIDVIFKKKLIGGDRKGNKNDPGDWGAMNMTRED